MDLASLDWNHVGQEILLPLILVWGARILGALAILLIGWWLIARAITLGRRLLIRARLDPMLIGFFASITHALLLLAVAIAALNHLGVYTTSLVAVLGAAGLAIALALQGSLGNLAAGVMIILFRPFRVGDFIEAAGIAGTVEEIRIFQTRLRTPDNREVIVPNARVSDGAITNNTARPTRRIDMVFPLDIDSDVSAVRRLVEQVLAAESRLLDDPAPVIVVDDINEFQIRLAVRPWVHLPDFLLTRGALYEAILDAFRNNGIRLARPARTLYVHHDPSAAIPSDTTEAPPADRP